MVITYHGEGCFKIISGNTSIVVDPLNERLKPDILLKTSVPFPLESPEENTISGAGEYELRGISIKGTGVLSEANEKIIKTVYVVEAEDILIGFLGELFKVPEAELIQALSEVDILILPVGGKPYLGAEDAAKIVKQIRPSIVIPSFYKNPKEFLEEMGQKTTPQEKLVIKKKEIAEGGEGTKVICLTT